MRYLIDTNVICEATAKAPDPNVMRWLEENTSECALSTLTIGEIWKGIYLMPKGKRRNAISTWAEKLEVDFGDVTLPLDNRVLKVWAELYARHESKGWNLGMVDSLIAASAIAYELTIVTRNPHDFAAEIRTINPWTV